MKKIIHNIKSAIGKMFATHRKKLTVNTQKIESTTPNNEYEDLTPLEQDILSDFEQLNEDEQLYILAFAAQLVASHNPNTPEEQSSETQV